ncbi:MAG TPA: GNAT family N-acetyltransferase, partial [Burkholderiales bacterium]|nr:GNAT family N-acetyltransferase [Burkholderiales bacterium]
EQVSIRAVRPDDRERIVTAFRGLDRGSVYRRFFFHKKELKEEELRRVTECDGVSAAVLVATVESGDGEIIVGLGEYMRSGAAADIAFAVEEDFQGRGIASRLLQQLAGIARANGILQFEADVLAENAPMLAVFHNSGLRMQTSAGQGVIHATLFLT